METVFLRGLHEIPKDCYLAFKQHRRRIRRKKTQKTKGGKKSRGIVFMSLCFEFFRSTIDNFILKGKWVLGRALGSLGCVRKAEADGTLRERNESSHFTFGASSSARCTCFFLSSHSFCAMAQKRWRKAKILRAF